MSDDLARVKHPASATLAGPYGHPYHPMLVTVPIGAWVASLVFDIASHLTASPEFLARGSSWLIAIGLVAALVAAATGFLDLIVIPAGSRAARTGIWHMSLVLVAMASYVGNLSWRHISHSRPGPSPGPVPAGPLALSVASLAILGIAGYLGGKLVFRYGVRVAAEAAQADGYWPPPAPPARPGPAEARLAYKQDQ
jgi:uncharacterized membrane protein